MLRSRTTIGEPSGARPIQGTTTQVRSGMTLTSATGSRRPVARDQRSMRRVATLSPVNDWPSGSQQGSQRLHRVRLRARSSGAPPSLDTTKIESSLSSGARPANTMRVPSGDQRGRRTPRSGQLQPVAPVGATSPESTPGSADVCRLATMRSETAATGATAIRGRRCRRRARRRDDCPSASEPASHRRARALQRRPRGSRAATGRPRRREPSREPSPSCVSASSSVSEPVMSSADSRGRWPQMEWLCGTCSAIGRGRLAARHRNLPGKPPR